MTLRGLGLLALVGMWMTGCFIGRDTRCDDGPVFTCSAGVVSLTGCGTTSVEAQCARGCGIARMYSTLGICGSDLCLENVPKKAGDACTTDGDCSPVPAESSATMVTNTYLACDTASRACVAGAAPTVADWLKPCSPDVVATITPSGTPRPFNRGAPDPGCAEGWCAAARVEGNTCVSSSCSRACTSDDQCPSGATCGIPYGASCETRPMGWCIPGGQAGIGFLCMASG